MQITPTDQSSPNNGNVTAVLLCASFSHPIHGRPSPEGRLRPQAPADDCGRRHGRQQHHDHRKVRVLVRVRGQAVLAALPLALRAGPSHSAHCLPPSHATARC